MSKHKKHDPINITGELVFGNLVKPDTRFTNGKPGTFNAVLRISESQAKAINEALKPLAQKMLEEEIENAPNAAKKREIKAYAMKLVAAPEEDRDTGEIVAGSFIIKAKQQSIIQPKDTSKKQIDMKVRGFDAKGKELSEDLMTKLGRGSKITIRVTPSPYVMPSTKACGVSLRLQAVQVLEYVEYSGANPFETVEGGFDASTVAPAQGGEQAPFSAGGSEEDGDF
jgi:hypothetical protein